MSESSLVNRRSLLRASLAAGALSVAGVPALTGCSNEGRGGQGSQAVNDAVQLPDYLPYPGVKPDLVGADGAGDAFLRYPAQPVAATDGPPGDGQPVTALTMSNTPAPPALGNNSFWQALNQRLGFPLSVQLVPSANFTERFQTAVAGDQLPELFSFFPGEVPALPALLEKLAVDLTPLLAGPAAAKYPFLANIPTESWEQSVFGGKIFGVPTSRGASLSSVLYGRSDLLASRGIDALPDSADAFLEFCREATGGRANAWALASVPMNALRQMFGVPNTWAEEDGRLVSAYEAERQQEALELGRKLVSEGLTHPDAFGVDGSQRKTWVANGTTVFMEDTFSAWPGFAELAAPKQIGIDVYPVPRADGGGPAKIWLGAPTHNITAISKKAEGRTEALLGVLNHLAAPFGTAERLFKSYGLPGVHHELKGSDPVLNDRGRSETALGLGYIAEGPWVIYTPGETEAVRLRYDAMAALVPTGVRNAALGLFSQTGSRKSTQIAGAMSDLQSDILQGRAPVSAWANGVATWKKDGGDAIRDELQQALDTRLGR